MTFALQSPISPDELKPFLDQFNQFLESTTGRSDIPLFSLLVPGALGIIILVAAVILLKKLLGGQSGPSGGFSPGSTRREAKKLRRLGEFQRAGELFELAGDKEDAAEMYRRAQAYSALGHLYEVMKDWNAAAGAYQAANDIDRANEMYQRAGDFMKAAQLLKNARRDLSAAPLFEKIGEHFEAARMYERTGHLQKAAVCYERAQDFLKAAQLYEKHFFQDKSRGQFVHEAGAAGKKNELAAVARSSGKLYLKTGNTEKAAKILEAAGCFDDAADAYIAIKDFSKAAELYHSAKQFRKAHELHIKAGNPQKAHQVLGEMYLADNDFMEAARMYERASDFLQAGDLYEKANEVKKAAEMYQKGGDFSRANELFQSVGDTLSSAEVLAAGKQYRQAADQLIKAGQFEKAAQLLEEAGDYYEAGKVFLQLGRIEDTIAFFQKVDTQSEHYYEASLVLGRAFMERGMLDTAKERFKKLLAKKEISNENLEAYYYLALIYEKNREFDNALVLYDRILAEDYKFKDVPDRIKAVKSALQKPKGEGETKTVEATGTKGRYRILNKIGQGGMGVVYKAEDTLLNRIVAYKVLPPTLSDNPSMLENFLREARVAAGINHANIVTIYDTGTEGEEPYIIMELVEGASLKQVLERTTAMNSQDIIEVAKQICTGLEHAHAKNVVHRDIKPANIMIRKDRVVKIMDFGLAKILTSASQEGTSVKGTPLYMSPEQIRGERADHRTDIYSLGCTLYRMATGTPPFLEGDVYYHHLNTDPIPPRVKNPKLPGSLEQIIMKCLEKNPDKRYQSARELLDALSKPA